MADMTATTDVRETTPPDHHGPETVTLSAPASSPDAPRRHPAPTWEDFHALEQRVEERADRRDGWTVAVWVVASLAVILSIVAIGFGSRAIADARHVVHQAAPTSAAPPLAASPGPVNLSDFKVQAAATTVAAGTVTFQITNTGTVQHELLVFRSDLPPSAYPLKDGNIDEEAPNITKVSDGDNIDPGATQTRTVDLTQPGTYLFVCNLPGHFMAGMYQVITVK